MPVSIDEVTAEVASPNDSSSGQAASNEPRPPSPSDARYQREQFERMQVRAARVCAD
ncbi:MAG TPA: hypothetical protein VE422_45770 [Terriglobia bacterium]|nr:hypothetical protein [Terriglobia bacterium]